MRKWRALLLHCVVVLLGCTCCAWGAATQNNAAAAAATGRFQAALQQQNYFTVLTSIEERLRNLDQVYSMQLAQTLEAKLEQYSRRLEALDTKMTRLEALVMLNLDKISENISTKNFKDDMAKTNLLRKMDSVYEGIGHRLAYAERKHDANIAKIQTKVDATLTRLDKMEENMATRDSDIETEISDAIFAIDDLKTTCTTTGEKLYNITTANLNVTKDSYKSMQAMNVDSRKSMNVLHDNIIETLQYMNNKTSRHFRAVEDNNAMLKTMKTELKEDFNDYANKVADMSSYIFKNSDATASGLKRLETVANNTKTEVQNGVRSLMLQIGKLSSKENDVTPGDSSLEELNQNLKKNFQRILTNQDVFLESCHRLQMDESQIETEISAMLEKLIDMLEKKMASDDVRDLKNLEKALKTHDSRIVRNMYQINNNVISLFEKSTTNNDALSDRIKKIDKDLEAFVQSIANVDSPSFSINSKVLYDKLDRLEKIISNITCNVTRLVSNATLPKVDEKLITEIQTFFSKALQTMVNETTFDRIISKHLQCNCRNENNIDDGTRKAIQDVFGSSPFLAKSSPVMEATNASKRKCKQSFLSLVNVRSKVPDCEESVVKKKKKGKKGKKKQFLLDVRGNFEPNEEYEDSGEDAETTTPESEDIEDATEQEYSTTEATVTTTNTSMFNFLEIK
ncbi:hypothetical protein NQ315_016392 [Exocentrus adspersus]|uniref:Uncharacterized protein n=1 Tax=Exocentrus adspersus TaxID=1586481 RepID=A0AAV8VQI0_9CUCU|nr:hypothetical protein NQ315_016392 [Exocentrus adspersus]